MQMLKTEINADCSSHNSKKQSFIVPNAHKNITGAHKDTGVKFLCDIVPLW
jgi:hypothetical protein